MTTPLWTWEALLAAANGVADGAPGVQITGFSIDTRSIQAGEVFVALVDSRDGHEFITAAFQAGAAVALVRADYARRPGDGALLRVDDPLRALERIGIAARARLSTSARVIAVTGSAGKTGTKEMLRAVLTPLGRTHAPEKSFNNHWGVPLTLARMPADTQFAVIEIGMNHAGEISPLTRMTRPHIAIITNVLPVHVGNFPDGEVGVANAKAEIFAGLVEGGHAILNIDNLHFERLAASAAVANARVVGFGTDPRAAIRARDFNAMDGATEIVLGFACRAVRFVVGAEGRHVATNALAVAAAIDVLGLPLEASLAPLKAVTAPAGRGARSALSLADGGAVLLIDESYNANPASMRAALATLSTIPRATQPRRIAVLGDMRELGTGSHDYHVGLAPDVIASGADLVFACGPYMKALFAALPVDRRGAWAATSTDLVAALRDAVRPGDVVMIKGSLGTNMAPLVAALRSLD